MSMTDTLRKRVWTAMVWCVAVALVRNAYGVPQECAVRAAWAANGTRYADLQCETCPLPRLFTLTAGAAAPAPAPVVPCLVAPGLMHGYVMRAPSGYVEVGDAGDATLQAALNLFLAAAAVVYCAILSSASAPLARLPQPLEQTPAPAAAGAARAGAAEDKKSK